MLFGGDSGGEGNTLGDLGSRMRGSSHPAKDVFDEEKKKRETKGREGEMVIYTGMRRWVWCDGRCIPIQPGPAPSSMVPSLLAGPEWGDAMPMD